MTPGETTNAHSRSASTRRYFLEECGIGLGKIALASLLAGNGSLRAGSDLRAINPLAPRVPHHRPRAKHVIYLFMAGGPSQLELFDYKPSLEKFEGTQVPESVLGDQELPFIERDAALMASPLSFARHGQSGAELSELLPGLASVADDVAIVRSMKTNAFNHAPAQILMTTGHLQLGKPSMGAWVGYGLGNEAEDLPAFVVLDAGTGVSGGAAVYGSGFLPSNYQGVSFRSQGEPVLFTANPSGYDRQLQRASLDAINRLNQKRLDRVGDPEIAARIHAYELAYRLQASAPELMDVKGETQKTLELYGADPTKASFANNCLLARRLVERGVRFVTIFQKGWDAHGDVVKNCQNMTAKTDQAATALILDLKQRGLLDETLIVWGGEFGRTPMVENNPALNRKRGRDHHPNAFSMWLAGGGIRGGQTVGKTDELGYHVAEDAVHVHDLQATILHLLGLDHTQLTYRHEGRDFRLTDVGGNVVERLLA